MISCSAAGLVILSITSAPAQQTNAYSNIVGYQKITLQEGRNLIGVNFRNTGQNTYYNVQDVIDTSTLQGGQTLLGSDRLYIWDAAAQEYVRLWLYETGQWVDEEAGTYAEQKIYPGDAIFLIAQAATETVVSGEVMDDVQTFTHAALDGRSMIASAWPVDIGVQDISFSGLVGGQTMLGSDRMYLWDTNTGDFVMLWLHETGQWVDEKAEAYADQVISAGSGFFIIKQNADELTEGKPY